MFTSYTVDDGVVQQSSHIAHRGRLAGCVGSTKLQEDISVSSKLTHVSNQQGHWIAYWSVLSAIGQSNYMRKTISINDVKMEFEIEAYIKM